jgi:hypothetical protein
MIVVGKKQVDPKLPSHVPGVHEGNWPRQKPQPGARRSTGIAPSIHAPIDPSMPKLTPP